MYKRQAPASVIAPASGALTFGANGTFTYTPNAGFNGTDSFTYEVTDGNGGSATATVNITVNSINDDPVAANDAFSTDEDTAYSATLGLDDLLQNDSDLDGDTLTVTTVPVNGPSDGSLVLRPDGTFTYTPDADFFGTDSFTYEVTDGNGGTAEATVNIMVDPVNDAPVANDDNFTVDEDDALTLPLDVLLINDTDVDGDSLAIGNVIAPASGTLTFGANGTFTYTPDPDFNGTDSFTYEVTDGNGGCLLYTSPSPRD